MKDKIVLTGNMTGFVSMVENLVNKPDRMDRLGLAFGKWGLGKTTTVEWFYANNPCFYVRAGAGWIKSPVMALEDILRAYKVEAVGKYKADFRELVRVAKKRRHPLFIDEADRAVRKSLMIETIRDIHDLARIPIILIGQENILNILQRRDMGQVFSRVTEIIEFRELSSTDIQRIASELCDLKCSPKVASFIRTVCVGDFRLINALLIKAEQMCMFNGVAEITQSIAKEAAMAMPHPDDMNRIAQAEKPTNDRVPIAVNA